MSAWRPASNGGAKPSATIAMTGDWRADCQRQRHGRNEHRGRNPGQEQLAPVRFGAQARDFFRPQGCGGHGAALYRPRRDEGNEWVLGNAGSAQFDVVDRSGVRLAWANAPFGEEAEPGGGQAQRFQKRAVCHMARVSVKVVEYVIAGVIAVDGDVVVADQFETPGLRVVAAGCPASEVEDLQQDVARHSCLHETVLLLLPDEVESYRHAGESRYPTEGSAEPVSESVRRLDPGSALPSVAFARVTWISFVFNMTAY